MLSKLVLLKRITGEDQGADHQTLGNFSAIRIIFRTFPGPLERTKSIKFGRHLKESNCPTHAVYPSHLQVKSNTRLKACILGLIF